MILTILPFTIFWIPAGGKVSLSHCLQGNTSATGLFEQGSDDSTIEITQFGVVGRRN